MYHWLPHTRVHKNGQLVTRSYALLPHSLAGFHFALSTCSLLALAFSPSQSSVILTNTWWQWYKSQELAYTAKSVISRWVLKNNSVNPASPPLQTVQDMINTLEGLQQWNESVLQSNVSKWACTNMHTAARFVKTGLSYTMQPISSGNIYHCLLFLLLL